MRKFLVNGMTCAACQARVERAVCCVEGVESCSVNLLLKTMIIEGDASDEQIILAVENAGYSARIEGEKDKSVTEYTYSKTQKLLVRRLVLSIVLVLLIMYLSMGYTMFSWYVPPFLEGNFIAIATIQLICSSAVLIINNRFFINGFKGVVHLSPNMDTLVALGSLSSYIYSVAIFILMVKNNQNSLHDLYFESAAMILTLITVGKLLEEYSKGKTTNALKGLISLKPTLANVYIGGKWKQVHVESVKVGEVFLVKPGEVIPVDGVVIKGQTSIDESALTGESLPIDKSIDSRVYAGTINTFGAIECKALKVGEDTTLSKIIKTVEDAAASKAPISRIADRVSGVFVPFVILIALITFIIWLIIDGNLGFSMARGVCVLVISCPCALGLATPVAIMVSSGVGAKLGVLFKNATSLERVGKVDIVALDKTGTITLGQPKVVEIITAENVQKDELLFVAFSLEKYSEHPLAKAINALCLQDISGVNHFEAHAGGGVSGFIDGKKALGGSINFISNAVEIPSNIIDMSIVCADEGKTPVAFCIDDRFLGLIIIADCIKQDSKRAIDELKKLNIKVVMLTGDNRRTANSIARSVGIDEVYSGVLPQDKSGIIEQLKCQGNIAMVGDGINDAPALTSADIGIAIGAGTDIAIDSADIVVMNDSLLDVVAAIKLSKKTLINIKENLFWAFIYNLIGIPLAAGVFINLFGWSMNPMFGAAAMSLSSICVVTNALRLNTFKIKEKKMTKTIKIEGMMCTHCEARVKKVLEKLPEVIVANVNYKKGIAKVELSSPVSDDVLKSVIEEQDYTVLNIE